MRILVIGGGPAGLSTAINAGKDGHEVIVFERSSSVCSKICGEALAKEGLDYVGIKPSSEFIAREVKGFKISFKGEFIKEALFKDLPHAPRYLIDKPLFLQTLSTEATKNGAKIFFNSRVEALDPQSGKIKVNNGQIHKGDLIVCADGIGTIAKRYMDYSGFETAICVQAKCSIPWELNPNYLYLDIIGTGYVWTFIKNNFSNIGAGLPRDRNVIQTIKRYLDKHIQKLKVKPLNGFMSSAVAIGGPLKNFNTGKLVVAGEAAGCVMPLSGEGIRFALYAGSIAYKSDYRRLFMEKYGKNMQVSKKIFQLIKKLSDKERMQFLTCLEDPVRILEGKWPKANEIMNNPKLLFKIAQKYIVR